MVPQTTADATNLPDDILLSMVEGIGARTYQRLIERFGSATAILDLSRSDLGGFEFLKTDTMERLVSARKRYDPHSVMELCQQEGIDIISLRHPSYPAPLRTIPDPPPLLYVRGKILPQDVFSLAVIGTRRFSSYGQRQTERLTTALAQAGFTIISGLARGIDGVAHRAALKAHGRTLAVLGSGLCKIYPPEHKKLAEEIVCSGGAIMSEYPPLHPSATWTFPQRNRIVSGLSLGVVVIEAPRRSGAMISARMAGEQGREIFAVPGSIESEMSRGCHQLIRDGALLVESVDDILEVLGPMQNKATLPGFSEPLRHPNELSLNEIEQRVLRQIGFKRTTVEAIVRASALATHQVTAALSALEEKRIVRFIPPDGVVRQ